MAFQINFYTGRYGSINVFREFGYIDQARECLKDLLEGVARHERAISEMF